MNVLVLAWNFVFPNLTPQYEPLYELNILSVS